MGRKGRERLCLVVEEELRILRMLRDQRYVPPIRTTGDSMLIQSATGGRQFSSRSLALQRTKDEGQVARRPATSLMYVDHSASTRHRADPIRL
jgi:hypothetical protein